MRNFSTRNNFNLILTLLGSVILLFILAPLLGIFFKTSGVIFFETIANTEITDSIILTLKVSFLTTIVASIFAIPLAYIIAKKDFIGKTIVQGIIDLPIVIPHSAAGIAILGFVSRDTVLGKFADSFGINFIGHPLGIGLAMGFVSIPFLINAAKDGFSAVPTKLEKASLSLGASQVRTFFEISLPLAKRNIVTGFILMFARGMSEFGAVIIIAYHPMVTPILIYETFSTYGIEYARAISAIFISVSLTFFILLRIIGKTENKTR